MKKGSSKVRKCGNSGVVQAHSTCSGQAHKTLDELGIKIVKPTITAARFWFVFCGLYLNLNRLNLGTAYKIAKEKLLQENSLTAIPNLRQVRYRVSLLPKNQVHVLRYGEAK